MSIKFFLLTLIISSFGFFYLKWSPKPKYSQFEVFENTPAWELAIAAKKENIYQIEKCFKEHKYNLNFQDSIYGRTVLMQCVINRKFNSLSTLLKLGADVNLHDKYDGSSALLDACDFVDNSEAIKYMSLLLDNRANPNDREVEVPGSSKHSFFTALIQAIFSSKSSPIEKVKLLVEHGADVNYCVHKNNPPFLYAESLESMDVLYYLLSKGANFRDSIDPLNVEKITLVQMLRRHFIELNTEKYQWKMKVVKFLEEHGEKYHDLPVPEFILTEIKAAHPNDWQEV